jgi:hypothetical protein
MNTASGEWDTLRKGVMAFLHDRNILCEALCKEIHEDKVEKLIETAIAVHEILCNPTEDCDKFEYLKVTLQTSYTIHGNISQAAIVMLEYTPKDWSDIMCSCSPI